MTHAKKYGTRKGRFGMNLLYNRVKRFALISLMFTKIEHVLFFSYSIANPANVASNSTDFIVFEWQHFF